LQAHYIVPVELPPATLDEVPPEIRAAAYWSYGVNQPAPQAAALLQPPP
jgi:hypothetical protein